MPYLERASYSPNKVHRKHPFERSQRVLSVLLSRFLSFFGSTKPVEFGSLSSDREHSHSWRWSKVNNGHCQLALQQYCNKKVQCVEALNGRKTRQRKRRAIDSTGRCRALIKHGRAVAKNRKSSRRSTVTEVIPPE